MPPEPDGEANPGPDGVPMESAEANAVEQAQPVIDGPAEPAPPLAPLESDVADANEQRQIVVTDDEYRR